MIINSRLIREKYDLIKNKLDLTFKKVNKKNFYTNYVRLKEFYKKVYLNSKNFIKFKYQKYNKKLVDISNKCGGVQVREFGRFVKPKFLFLSFKSVKIFIEGSIYLLAFTGVVAPMNLIHRIFGFGLAPFLAFNIVKKAWKGYVEGKILINIGEIPEGPKEVNEEELEAE